MTYINPEIYDPAKLTGDERLTMDGFDAAIEEVESFFDQLEPPSTGAWPRTCATGCLTGSTVRESSRSVPSWRARRRSTASRESI